MADFNRNGWPTWCGIRRHQAGFAIDFNGVASLEGKQLKELNKIGEKYGFKPLSNQKKDLPHFDANPKDYGYKDLNEAVQVNKADFLQKAIEP